MLSRRTIFRFASILCGTSLLLSAPAWAQSASTTPELLDSTAAFPNAGGSYAPVSQGSFDLFKEATSTDDIATNPEVTIHFEAGAWGTGGNEPMVFTYVQSNFAVVGNAGYLRATVSGAGYARVPCVRDVDVHCECLNPAPTPCYHYTLAAASVRRPYRLVNTSGMMLPAEVLFIPVLVDYAVHRGDIATLPLPDDQTQFNHSAKVRLSYPDGQATFSRGLDCRPAKCVETFSGVTAPPVGTLEVPVTLDGAGELLLDISAAVWVNDQPDCVTVSTAQGDMCLVPPYSGEAWVHVDPYVYVDPSWEYADWFEVQTTTDEAGTQWVEAVRTVVDLSTFGLEGTSGTGGTAGVPDGGVPDAGAGGAGGTAGSGGSSANGEGGGCSVATSSQSSGSQPALLMLFVAAAIAVRRRSWKRGQPPCSKG
jgi:MYXO-CTERM domain-containing protein